jgi:beta-glucosidase
MNRYYLDPVFLGRYPAELREVFGEAWRDPSASDMELIQQPVDFVGVNYYTRGVASHAPDALPVRTCRVRQPQHAHTETGWEVYPAALTRVLCWVKERYGDIRMYVTENGAAFYDPPQPIDGRVDDPLRIWYLREHLLAARDAMRQGVDLRGYFVWSLLDNYEWSLGVSKRFGIVHVNYETMARTPKASAHWYANVIRSHGEALALPGATAR